MRRIHSNWLAALALLAGTEAPLALAAEPETVATAHASYIEGGIGVEESLLGIHVDLLTPADLPSKFRDSVLAEALPV